MESVPIDRGWAWMTVLGAAVCSFFFVGGIKSLGIILVEVVTRFSASTATASLIMAIVSVGVAIIAPLSTALGERFTYRAVIMAGGALCALGSFLMAFATTATYAIIVYGTFTGIGFGCIAGPSLVVVGQYFNQRRALANGLAVSGGSVGQLVIPLLMYHLIKEYGFMGGLMLYSAISLHVILAAFLMRPFSFYNIKKKKPKLSSNTPNIQVEDYRLLNTADSAKAMEEDNNNLDLEMVPVRDVLTNDLSEQTLEMRTQHVQIDNDTNVDLKGRKPLLDTGQLCDRCHQTTVNLVGCSCKSNIHHVSEHNGMVRTGISMGTGPKENQVWIELSDMTNKLADVPFLDSDDGHFDDVQTCELTDQPETACECDQSFLTPKESSQSGVLRSLHKMSRVERQQSTLSRISVRSLDVISHQEVPDSPEPDTRRGILCPEDILINCCCCCTSSKSTAKPLIPWGMFKEPLFILYICGICVGNSGYINACLFLPAHAEDIGMSRSSASWLLSIMGIVDLVGRIGGGWVSDLGYVSRSRILAWCLFVTGLATFICIPIRSQASLIGLSVITGLFGGCCVSLQIVVLVDFFGADKLSATCGLSIMCQGLINIFVPSLLGIIRDSTGSYFISYYIAASLMVLATIIFSFESCARKKSLKI